MSEESTNGHVPSKIAILLPGSAADAAEREVTISLVAPNGDEPGVFCVFGFLDGQTRAEYHRVAERNSRRGQFNYDAAVRWLFKKKCKRIEGLSGDEPELAGMAPMDWFIQDKNGNTLLNLAVGLYLDGQIGSAADASKSR